MFEVLTNPTQFFRRLFDKPANLAAPLFISALSSAAAGLATALAYRTLPSLFPFPFALQAVFIVLSAFVMGILIWGLTGLVVWLFGGKTSRAFEIVGWAAMVSFVVALVLLPVAAMFPISGDLGPIPDLTGREEVLAWQKSLTSVIKASTFSKLSTAISAGSLIWTAWIYFSGLKITVASRAVLATAVPILLSFAYVVYQVVQL